MALSGRWKGYWEQAGWGREVMRLALRLEDGRIEGEGDDCVGPFTFRGQYSPQGKVSMVKQYLGQHRVRYEGTYDGEGTIFGHWYIPPAWTGPFVLSLEAAEGGAVLREIVPKATVLGERHP